MVRDYWKSGYKYFEIDLGDGEARMCLSSAKTSRINLTAYDVDMHPHGKVYYIDFLQVSPWYRNRGHGSTVLKAAIRWANLSKNVIILDAIPLDSGIDKHRLMRFYLSHGFKRSTYKNSVHSMYYHNRTKTKKSAIDTATKNG